jgi:hypothetical protein
VFVFITTKAGFLSGTRLSSGTVVFAIFYSSVIGDDSRDFSWLNRTFLHLVNVGDLADGGWSFRLLERSYFDHFIPARSLVFSVPGEGFYLISGEREGRIGYFVEPGHPPGFWVNSSGRFVPEVSVLWMPSHTPPTTRPATLTPPATATESIAFIQSGKLCFYGSGVPAITILAPESFTVVDSKVFPRSELLHSEGPLPSQLPHSDGPLQSQLLFPCFPRADGRRPRLRHQNPEEHRGRRGGLDCDRIPQGGPSARPFPEVGSGRNPRPNVAASELPGRLRTVWSYAPRC